MGWQLPSSLVRSIRKTRRDALTVSRADWADVRNLLAAQHQCRTNTVSDEEVIRAVLSVPVHFSGWTHVQDTPGSNGTTGASSSPLSLGAFGSAVTINNFVIVTAWGYTTASSMAASSFTCTDNGATPNTYTQFFQSKPLGASGASGTMCAAIFVAQITSNPASGNINPKITNSGAGPQIIGCAAEFSGGTTSSDGTSGNGNTNNLSNQPTCGNMNTTVANDLLVACFGLGQAADLTGLTDPTGYTSIGRTLSELQGAGSGVYKIASGTVTNNNPAWTVTGGSSLNADGWAAVQVALQPASSGGTTFPASSLVLGLGPNVALVGLTPTAGLLGGPVGLRTRKKQQLMYDAMMRHQRRRAA